MSIRFKNARILLTKGKEFEIIKGELHTNGNRIAKIVNFDAGDSEPNVSFKGGESKFDRVIDCQNNLLIPGFKNCHAHTAMTVFRSLADDMPLQDWLFKQIFPREDKLVPDDIYWLTVLGIMEYLKSGITGTLDSYFFQHIVAKVAHDVGYRITQSITINNFGPAKEVIEERYLKSLEYGDLNKVYFGVHAEYTCSKELCADIVAMAHKYKAPFITHISETEKEVSECKERYGVTPLRFFYDLGAFKYGGGGYHGVYYDDEDLKLCADEGLYLVTNPASNLKLASGIAPIRKALDMGVKVAIGTDGAASNNALDFFREMYLTSVLPKYREMDAAAVSASDVLYCATSTGAHCMGTPNADCLAVGKLADLVMINMYEPNMQPENNIVKNIVYSGSKSNVALTMVNGKVLYENGKFDIGFDPMEIYTKANEILKRIEC